MLKMHWLLVRSSMIHFIHFFRELGHLGTVLDEGSGCFCFFIIRFLFFIFPPAEGAEAEQAPVFHLKQNKINPVHNWILQSPKKAQLSALAMK